MRVFFATSHTEKYVSLLQKEGVENVLFSYAFFKSPIQTRKIFGDYNPKNLIIDSGAFSVWTRGEEVNIDQYAYFCEQVKELFPLCNIYCVNLDVLPGKFGQRPTQRQVEESASEGWKNMEYLESKGLKVIPVFHQHESFEWLDKLRNHCDYIGISPANDVSMKEKLNWLNQVFSIIKDTIKTHGFAVTSWEQLYRYPFFSVDSSSWTSPSRFGSIPVFTDTLKMKVFKYKDKKQVQEVWDYIKDWGIEALASNKWEDRIRLSIKSYLQLHKQANKLWKSRGINQELLED
jgi:hypothetical protein